MLPLLSLLIPTALVAAHGHHGHGLDAQNATASALVYGFPLPLFAATAIDWATTGGTTEWANNHLSHADRIATAEERTVVLPNVDTVYSVATIDLTQKDVVAEMGYYDEGRTLVWTFYDMFSNAACAIGTVRNDTLGKYLITHRYANPGCDLTPSGEYAGTIYIPTAYALTLIRNEVNNQTDLDYVRSHVQPTQTLTEIERAASSGEDCDDAAEPIANAPPLTEALLTDGIDANDKALAALQLLARFAATNPPPLASEIPKVASMLTAAGINTTTQSYTTPSSVNLTLAEGAAKATIAAVPTNPADWIRPNPDGSWVVPEPAVAGDFGSHYAERAYVGLTVYLELPESQALYPSYRAPTADTQLSFTSNNSYLVEFSGKPPATGFWSLTVYDDEGFLVDNEMDRYSVSDRGNLTYPDGTRVYGGDDEKDGKFYVLLQATDAEAIAPEWESNWLPTPAGGIPFQFYLRFYGPDDAFLDGSYIYPIISLVDANPPMPTD
ncbi:DUF1254-domain-containing protein [Mycena kentingensis (nom. inval.)]|nr:DUF1254-domain-containing protein [Mycena kentingensis (nom. inval.)]